MLLGLNLPCTGYPFLVELKLTLPNKQRNYYLIYATIAMGQTGRLSPPSPVFCE